MHGQLLVLPKFSAAVGAVHGDQSRRAGLGALATAKACRESGLEASGVRAARGLHEPLGRSLRRHGQRHQRATLLSTVLRPVGSRSSEHGGRAFRIGLIGFRNADLLPKNLAVQIWRAHLGVP